MDILSYLATPFTDPLMLVAVALGTLAGVYVGAIPGLTGTMAVSASSAYAPPAGWGKAAAGLAATA